MLDHTITDEAVSVYSKEVVTDGVGHFNFVVPTKKNGSRYYYDDIALHDKVKIYYGYDSVGATPDFIGFVGAISAPLSTAGGYTRRISGLSQGEILLRRQKQYSLWSNTGVSTIVTELANDLGLGTGDIVADATAITYETEAKSYLDVLRDISDYWASAGTQIKKDFYVDVDFDLVWKARPLRTVGVETFTVGDNIISYDVTQKIEEVKNYITVYGERGEQGQTNVPGHTGRTSPTDKDSYTENSDSGWTFTFGTRTWAAASPQIGSYNLHMASQTDAALEKTHASRVPGVYALGRRGYLGIQFYSRVNRAVSYDWLRLYCPDASNYYQHNLNQQVAWQLHDLGFGENEEYDATYNPTGAWTKTGSPVWHLIAAIHFYCEDGAAYNWELDGLHFTYGRFRNIASDGTSQTSYGKREMEVLDDKLRSDSDCEKRSRTLLYQLKDPPKQIELTVPGNTNVLVGDRLSMTIPAENISAVDFDVLSVEHSFTTRGFITKATMMNSANIRKPVSTSPMALVVGLRRRVKELGLNENVIS